MSRGKSKKLPQKSVICHLYFISHCRKRAGRFVIVTADSTEGHEGNYRVGFSETAEYDPDHIKMNENVSLADLKKGLAGLANGSMVIGENRLESVKAQENAPVSDEGVVGDQVGAEGLNEAQRGGNAGNTSTRRAIAVTEDGKVFVKASRNVISGNDRTIWKKQIYDFFDSLLSDGDSLDIPTIEGDTLTITWDETAYKARDDQKQIGGAKMPMGDVEFKVKLNAAAHIDELAEVSTDNPNEQKADSKNHGFAKDGFGYRTAYFEDFDGQYYKIKLSIGKNGDTATVYNVGQITKDALPSAKIIAVAGSRPLRSTSSGTIIAQNPKKSTTSGEKVS